MRGALLAWLYIGELSHYLFKQQIEQGSSHLGAQMAYISSFESDFCSMVWIRLRKWPSLGLFSEIDAFWLEGLKRLNPSAFFVFASFKVKRPYPVARHFNENDDHKKATFHVKILSMINGTAERATQRRKYKESRWIQTS